MGTRVVEPDESHESKNFVKFKDIFQNIGDKFVGLYQSDTAGQYGQDYTFKGRDGQLYVLTAKGGLKDQLLQLAPAVGEKVTITLAKLKDTGKESPLRLFRVAAEDGPKVAPKPPPVDEWA
jgi:hypothetical protein